MSWKVTVKLDSEMCIGCWACAWICEEIFEMDWRVAYVKKQPQTDEEMECAQDAADSCCVEAITFE